VYPPLPPGAPITGIANETWTWVDVAGTKCANGTPTGIGVNFTSKSDDVLIFLEGGGACWDGSTCWGATTSAVNLYGYGAAQFATDAQLGATYTMNRLDPDNAFKDMNIVYVPYCTGDSHSGDATTTLSYAGIDHPTSFAGFTNVGFDLARVVATFPNAKRVWLSGDSAGGFGSAFNFGRVQEAFPGARVDVLDDSGQPIAPDPTRWPTWKSAWNMQLPSDCAACADGPGGFVDYYATKYPSNRFGLISFAYDTVIPTFMNLTPTQFHDELYALAGHMDASWKNGGYFVLAGSSHVGLATPTPALKTWVTKMVTDDATWASTKP
ncbi:MAG TPA: pectin acetylesterase-family hydrolase, partial [Polyangiaceae bacterium]